MTITYSENVVSCKRTGSFIRLLFRWKGSMYKLVWPDMFVYFTFYFIISFYYRFVLVDDPSKQQQRIYFESLVNYCGKYANEIPLSFVLGFYVTIIINRWWKEFLTLPWPDQVAYYITTVIVGGDERSRLFRRTIIRYVNLSMCLAMGMICPQVKLRFPTLEHFIKAGILLPHEKIIIETLNLRSKHPKYWIPLIWSANIASRARREGRIYDDISLNLLIDQLVKFRARLGDILGYDWVNIPLVYSQAVTVATYLYFVANLIGKQFVRIEDDDVDIYIPIFQIFEFLFYMGWLRVAETLINPFGNDDDDFELNYILDRNFQTSYFIVDELFQDHPILLKDVYWDCFAPDHLPYTRAAMKYKMAKHHEGSAANHGAPFSESQYIARVYKHRNEAESDLLQKRKQAFEVRRKHKARLHEEKLQREREEYKQQNEAAKSGERESVPAAGTSEKSETFNAGEDRKRRGGKTGRTTLYNKVALVYKTVAERKRRDMLFQGEGGYWKTISGPVLSDITGFYEPEYPEKYVPTKMTPASEVMVEVPEKRVPRERKYRFAPASDTTVIKPTKVTYPMRQ